MAAASAKDEPPLSLYRAIIESLDDPVCRWLPDGTLTYCNARYREIFGVRNENCGAHTWLDFVAPTERPALARLTDDLLRNPRPVTRDDVATAADGSRRWFSWNHVPLLDATGALIGFQSVGRDITARKHDEIALAESATRLGEAQRVAGIGSWELDLGSQRLMCSDEVYKLFEIERASFGASYEAFLAAIHPDDRERVIAARTRSVADHASYEVLHRLRMADGRVKWIRERGETLPGDGGRAVRSVGTVQDVTQQVLAEKESSRMHGLLQFIIDACPDWIFAKDLNHRFVMVNRAFAGAQGLAPEQMIGRADTEFWPRAVCEGDAVAGLRGFHNDDRRAFAGETLHNPGDVATLGDGSVRIFDAYKGPLKDADGRVVGVFSYQRDVTDRVDVERELEASRAYLRAIVENEPECVKLLDRDGNLLDMNPAGLAMIGAESLEQVRGRGVRSLVSPPDRREFDAMLAAVFRGESRKLSFGLTSLKGVRRHLETHSVPLWDEGRRVVTALLGVTRDVTEHRQAESALRASEARYRDLFASNPHPMWVYDVDTLSFLEVNDAAVLHYGYSRDEFLAMTIRDIRPPEDVARLMGNVARAAEGVNEAGIWRHRRRNGQTILVEIRTHAVDFRGRRSELVLANDVTERARAQEALRSSEARLSFLLGSSPVVIYTCAPRDGFPATYVSPNVEELFGYAPGAWLSQPGFWTSNIHADDAPRVLADLEQHLFRDNRHQHEYRLRLPDGSYRWIHDELRLLRDVGGEPAEIIGYRADIDDRRRAEEELERHRERLEELVQQRTQHLQLAKNEAERANKAKSEFLSRMSHELRTPMNAILGFAQVLQLQPLDARQRRFVDEIYRAGDHLLRLIDDLLDISRIEVGKVSVAVQPTGLRKVVAEALQIVRPMLAGRNITLRELCDASDDQYVMADPDRLRQILVNLLSNAVKYNSDGGSIELGCRPGGVRRVRLLVTDTGRGIAAHRLPQLFEPFERLGAEATAVEGTGIGLALSKQLAHLMGADLGVESTVGVGSTFWIDLPEAQAAQPTPAGPGRLRSEGADEVTLLYVEDNFANLQVVEAMLGMRPGLRVLSATHGEEGLRVARRESPDVILLDVHLPGLDGYAVLSALRADPATCAIPVVALSADAMPADFERGRRAGFDDYLTKPVRFEPLLAALEAALRRRPATRSANA